MSNSFTHSDLIHLFIDGEATETERNTLFGALKDSPELQEEFSSAMQLKQAFASDIMKLQPPSYLQSKIAERAGLIVAASSSVATAPVVVNSISNSLTSALTTAAPVAATGISKVLMTLLIGTAVGVFSTIGVIQLTKEDPKGTGGESLLAVSRSSIGDGQSQVANEGLSNTSNLNNLSSTIDDRRSTIDHSPTLRSAASLQVRRFIKGSVNRNASAIAGSNNGIHTDLQNTPSPIEIANNGNANSAEGPAIAENISQGSIMPLISTTEPMIQPVKNVGSYLPNHTPFYDGSEGFFTEPDWLAHISVSYRTMPSPTAKVFQGGDDNAVVPAWNNMGWGLKYEIDPFSAVALEGGLETFPVYLAKTGGGYTGHHSIGWGGASFTYSFPFAEVLGIHPEVRALAGMSMAGPIAKFSAGLIFQPVGHFAVSVEPEYTALFIKENGAIRAGSKLGITYSLRFHF